MSAICGIFHRDGAPASIDALMPTLTALAHYGDRPPRTWSEGGVALGHVMNALTPQDALTPQPVTRGAYTIVADARLDNRADLFAALDVPSVLHADTSDAALILMAYARWGEACPQHLIGDFAFALWDADARRLLLGRDPIGARPLFYCLTPKRFAFASELSVLLDMPGVERRINEDEIARLLLTRHGFIQTDSTYWRDVYPLPFGCVLTVSADQHRQRRYDDFTPRREVRFASIDGYADALYALVETAVRDRLRLVDGIGVGAHCSGGIDSSSIAALVTRARRADGLPAPTWYSWSPPPEPGTDIEATEHRRIERLAAREGVTVYYADTVRQLQPIDPARYPINTLTIEQHMQPIAAEHGVRLMFSGWGGDEGISFNARGLAAERLLRGQWRALARQLRLRRALKGASELRAALGRLWDAALLPTLPDALVDLLYPAPPSYIHPDLLRRTSGRRATPPSPRERAGAHTTQRRLLRHGHITERMACWAWSGARHGISYVYPLADRRVLDFALSIPPDLYLQEGKGRYLYRRTMVRLLGEAFVWDTVKRDTAFMERAEEARARRREEKLASDAPALKLLDGGVCPWVDADRLRAAIGSGMCQPGTSEARLRVAADTVLRIWSFRSQAETGREEGT